MRTFWDGYILSPWTFWYRDVTAHVSFGTRIFQQDIFTVAVWTQNPFTPLLTCPQGSQGCQKMRRDPLNMPVEVWCAKIAPKLKNI